MTFTFEFDLNMVKLNQMPNIYVKNYLILKVLTEYTNAAGQLL